MDHPISLLALSFRLSVSSTKYKFRRKGNIYYLTIRDVRLEDAGPYKCGNAFMASLVVVAAARCATPQRVFINNNNPHPLSHRQLLVDQQRTSSSSTMTTTTTTSTTTTATTMQRIQLKENESVNFFCDVESQGGPKVRNKEAEEEEEEEEDPR